jgi:DNA-binding GntR family transcriptional regulator
MTGRGALRALAAEGLVELVRNRGAQVRTWSTAQIDDTYSLRAELEGFAARRAAMRSQPDDLADLIEIQDELEDAARHQRSGWLDDVADANVRFHTRILEISQTPFLGGFVATLHSASFVRRAFRGYTPDDLQRTMRSHRDIIAGIQTANADLSEASMRAHILAAIPAANQVFREQAVSAGDQP